jgi:hypothetical protein
MKEEIVIFDIHGTLADVSERIHHLQKKPKNWKAFFRGMAQDQAIKSMVACVGSYIKPASGSCCVRDEEHRSETVQWLKKERVR